MMQKMLTPDYGFQPNSYIFSCRKKSQNIDKTQIETSFKKQSWKPEQTSAQMAKENRDGEWYKY